MIMFIILHFYLLTKNNTKMRKSILSLFVVLAAMFGLSSCGDDSSKIEQSPEMIEFVGMIKGQSSDVVAALAKFGATDDIKTNDICFYNLSEPVVKEKKDNCYTVDFKSGIIIRTYDICWKDGKITSIAEKEVKE